MNISFKGRLNVLDDQNIKVNQRLLKLERD